MRIEGAFRKGLAGLHLVPRLHQQGGADRDFVLTNVLLLVRDDDFVALDAHPAAVLGFDGGFALVGQGLAGLHFPAVFH